MASEGADGYSLHLSISYKTYYCFEYKSNFLKKKILRHVLDHMQRNFTSS